MRRWPHTNQIKLCACNIPEKVKVETGRSISSLYSRGSFKNLVLIFWARIRVPPGTHAHPDGEGASREHSTAYRWAEV